MQCHACTKTAIIAEPQLCKDHYLSWFEQQVQDALEADKIRTYERLAVACSGGKDSTTILSLLKRFGYTPEALAIDEGIPGYRDRTLEDLRTFCTDHNIPLTTRRFEDVYGFALAEKTSGIRACRNCGVLRRHLLNQIADGYDVIVTGHNLDDEFQSLMMNLLKANITLTARTQRGGNGFVRRIKPLAKLSEKQVLVYALIHQFPIGYVECPNAKESYRTRIREAFLQLESALPGLRKTSLEMIRTLNLVSDEEQAVPCTRCGAPAKRELCQACTIVMRAGQGAL